MKKILVPTDFSENAYQALRYAIRLANHTGAALTLYHVFRSGLSERMDGYVRQSAEEQIDELIQRVQSSLEGAASVNGVVIQGETVDAILDRTARQSYDLVIMGTEGENGIKGFLVGSVTLEVIRRTQKPVLALPANAKLTLPQRLIFALDDQGISTTRVLQPLREIAAVFDAEVKVFHQSKELKAVVPDLLVDEALDGLRHSFHQEASEEEVWERILQYTLDQKADLLCLIRRERGFLERLFHHSVTREELSSSPVPLLILHDPH
jgi:nucleotide-binding universal stress UspA family protein